MFEEHSVAANAEPQKDGGGRNILAVLRKYTTVEILMLCYVLPSYLNYIAIQNLALEKSCRVNFDYSDEICDNMIDKSLNNINCVDVRSKLLSQNETHLIKEDVFNSTHFLNGTEISLGTDNKTVIIDLKKLDVAVCQAENDSQGLETSLNAFIAPFESILGVIMILFGGSWSDRHGKRKPCMLIPLIGETISLVVLLITAVFFKQLPVQFHIILIKIIPALCGGLYLMLMGVYSYLTEETPEADRTFRYSIFAQFIQILPILAFPFADVLYRYLGYTKLFLLCIPFNVVGCLYIIFGLKEVQRKPSIEMKGVDNPTFHNGTDTEGNGVAHDNERPTEKKSKGFLRDFFDPTMALQCIEVITKKRLNGEQAIIIFLIILHFISIGVAQGESPNEYLFTRQKLNWEGEQYTFLSSYSSGVSFIGTTIIVFFLSKVFECSDPFMGIVGTTLSGIARIFYIIATSSVHMFVGKTFDACAALRALVVRAVLSKFVDASEIGRTFSVLALVESLCAFVYVDLYSYVYTLTLDDWPAAIFVLSLILLVITLVFFTILFFILKNKEKRDAEEAERKMKEGLENGAATKVSGLSETTHL